MIFGGFVKQSLIDYPGKVAAVLFTQGCNFCCGYCHNPQLVLPRLFSSPAECSEQAVMNYLNSRKNWLDAVVITGGEPSIHSDLPDFLQQLRGLGLAIKLDTNGSNPQLLQHLLDKSLVDYVAMDIKTLPLANYGDIIGRPLSSAQQSDIALSIEILKNATIEVEFRTTIIPQLHTPQTIELLQQTFKNARFTTNHFRSGNTVSEFV